MRSKPLLRPRRRGFTLVEVALAVAVGLIVITGAVMGYNAVKDNANDATGRNRVNTAMIVVEEYAAANFGRYPVSVADDGTGASTGAFTNMWRTKRVSDYNVNAWGGSTGDANDGVTELAPVNFGFAVQPPPETISPAIPTAVDLTRAGNMVFVTPSTGAPWGGVQIAWTSQIIPVKNYAVGIYGKTGIPWYDAKGGK